MRSDIVAELDWRFGELAAWAVGQSTLAPPVAGMSVIAAVGRCTSFWRSSCRRNGISWWAWRRSTA